MSLLFYTVKQSYRRTVIESNSQTVIQSYSHTVQMIVYLSDTGSSSSKSSSDCSHRSISGVCSSSLFRVFLQRCNILCIALPAFMSVISSFLFHGSVLILSCARRCGGKGVVWRMFFSVLSRSCTHMRSFITD